jgi:bifunctional enzyme CysN/CysC
VAAITNTGKNGSCVVWFSGISGAGKTTIARIVVQELAQRGCLAFLLDGDLVRQGLSSDLGYSELDRTENLRRSAEVAALLADTGVIVLAAFITPQAINRERIRAILSRHAMIEAFVDTPIEVAEQRDVKGLYRSARSGAISNFTGISAPFEPPLSPDLRLDTSVLNADELAMLVVDEVIRRRDLASKPLVSTSA